MHRLLALLLLSLAALPACGDDDDDRAGYACTPGASVACTCSSGAKGAQVCQADQNSYSACKCEGDTNPDPGGTAGSGGSGGAAGSTAGGEPGLGCVRAPSMDSECAFNASASTRKAYDGCYGQPVDCVSANTASIYCCP